MRPASHPLSASEDIRSARADRTAPDDGVDAVDVADDVDDGDAAAAAAGASDGVAGAAVAGLADAIIRTVSASCTGRSCRPGRDGGDGGWRTWSWALVMRSADTSRDGARRATASRGSSCGRDTGSWPGCPSYPSWRPTGRWRLVGRKWRKQSVSFNTEIAWCRDQDTLFKRYHLWY